MPIIKFQLLLILLSLAAIAVCYDDDDLKIRPVFDEAEGLQVSLSGSGSYDEAGSGTDDEDELSRSGEMRPWTNFRLPRDIIPFHYKIELRPFFYTDSEDWFKGKVTIDATVNTATRYIVIHTERINITTSSIRIRLRIGERLKIIRTATVKRSFSYPKYKYFVIELTRELAAKQNISISMAYRGTMANSVSGFYKGTFRPPGEHKKLHVVMTQFEALGARRAFPCFDEPNFKAYFTVIIDHMPSVVAFSNMPLESRKTTEDDNGLNVKSTFKTTSVRMSTYLVAWVVGAYPSSVCKLTSTNLPICVYSPQYLSGQLKFSLQKALVSFEWLQNYFGYNYPLPKIDMIVYPQMGARAMENWGLISYREEALLASRDSTEVEKDAVEGTVVHELAHQWFGNLVTMDWWDDLWLNEGFASYMEYPAAFACGGTYNGRYFKKYLEASPLDAYESTRQIRVVDIKTGNDIEAAFDAITYRKGASIIRMLVAAMGDAQFREGIRHYMRKFQYGNTITTDLWKSLSRYSKFDVDAVMTTWVEQKGYPVVSVDVSEDGRQLVLTQERFVLPQWRRSASEDSRGPRYNERWHIPIIYRRPDNENVSIKWFQPDLQKVVINFPEGVHPQKIKLNVDQAAFVRFNYALDTWETFGKMLLRNINAFGPIDRAGLVADSLELAKAGRLSYHTVFTFLRFLAKETHPSVWEAFADHVTFLRNMLGGSTQFRTLVKFVFGLVRSARDAIVTSDDFGSDKTKLRTAGILSQISLAFSLRQEVDCYAEYFTKGTWKEPRNLNFRRAIFAAYMLSADSEQTFEELSTLARESSIKEVKNSVQYAQARTKNFNLISSELEKVFTGELTPADFIGFASQILFSPERRNTMWRWVQENWDRLKTRFEGQNKNFLRFVVSIASFFDTEAKYKEFEAFAEKVGNFGAGERSKNQMMEKMRMNIHWRRNLRSELESILAQQSLQISSLFEEAPIRC